jgi:hypothetical protein
MKRQGPEGSGEQLAGFEHKADFSRFVGLWIADPAFDEVIAAQRRIEWKKWK